MARNRKRAIGGAQAGPARQIALLTDLEHDPPAQRAAALEFVAHAEHPAVLDAALGVLRDHGDAASRRAMHERYERCEAGASPDGSGAVRAAIVRALGPIATLDDRPLLLRALLTYRVVGMYELNGDLRTAALLAMNDLEPETAALFAARFLHDPAPTFSAEPALTAVRVLAAQQRLEPLFALASWRSGNPEVLEAALRSLVELPAEFVQLLVDAYRDETEERVLLGLYDLLLAHQERARWRGTILAFLRASSPTDLFGVVVTQIVASRDGELIDGLRALAQREPDRRKAEVLAEALRLA